MENGGESKKSLRFHCGMMHACGKLVGASFSASSVGWWLMAGAGLL
jgi:hypothetical protein